MCRLRTALGMVLTLSLMVVCGGSADVPVYRTVDSPAGEALNADVILRNYSFAPRRFEVRVGDTVQFNLRSLDIIHNFTIQELGIEWQVPKDGVVQQSTVFDTSGEFRLICTIPGHEAMGMFGVLTVTEEPS